MTDKEKNKNLSSDEDRTIAETILPDEVGDNTKVGASSINEETDLDDSDLVDDEELEDDSDEEMLSLKDKIINFIKDKSPFLYGYYLKVTKQKDLSENIEEEEEDVEDTTDEDESEQEDKDLEENEIPQPLGKLDVLLGNFKIKLFEKLPFLKALPIFKNKKAQSGENIKVPPKRILSKPVTYVIFLGLIAWLLFDEGFEPAPEKKDGPIPTKKEEKVAKVTPTEPPVVTPESSPSTDETKSLEEGKSELSQVENSGQPSSETVIENNETSVNPETSEVTNVPVEETPSVPVVESEKDVTPVAIDSIQLPEEPTPAPLATEESGPVSQNTEIADKSSEQPLAPEVTPEAVDQTQVSKDTTGNEPDKQKVEPPPGKVEIEKTKNLDNEIRDIIEKVEEKYSTREDYESAPDYTKKGRGLVYSCKNKHWACLNRTNYHQCRKNMIYFSKLKTPPECVVFDVYYSDEDCDNKHKEMVNKVIPVPACSEVQGN